MTDTLSPEQVEEAAAKVRGALAHGREHDCFRSRCDIADRAEAAFDSLIATLRQKDEELKELGGKRAVEWARYAGAQAVALEKAEKELNEAREALEAALDPEWKAVMHQTVEKWQRLEQELTEAREARPNRPNPSVTR